MRLNNPAKEEPMLEKFTKKEIQAVFASCILEGINGKHLKDQDLKMITIFFDVFSDTLDDFAKLRDPEDFSKN